MEAWGAPEVLLFLPVESMSFMMTVAVDANLLFYEFVLGCHGHQPPCCRGSSAAVPAIDMGVFARLVAFLLSHPIPFLVLLTCLLWEMGTT